MDRVSVKLTVYFENPFWIGIFERSIDERLSVCKVIFGAEPKDNEVLNFVLNRYNKLKYSPEILKEEVFKGKENSKLTEIIDFFTLGISNLSYITEWISNPAIWFIVEMETQNLIVKVTKDVIDTNKFTFDKTKLLKLGNKI